MANDTFFSPASAIFAQNCWIAFPGRPLFVALLKNIFVLVLFEAKMLKSLKKTIFSKLA
jgi:hypothetical protein